MKTLLLFFLFISGIFFGQEKTLFKAVSYNNLIELYNEKLGLKNEDLIANIERCKYIVADAKKKQNPQTEIAFNLFLIGLLEASSVADKNTAFLSVYQDATSYSLYNSQNKFVARLDKHQFDEQIEINGNKTETFISNYFYILQE